MLFCLIQLIVIKLLAPTDNRPTTILQIQKQLTEAGVEKHELGSPQKVCTIKIRFGDISAQQANITLAGVLYR